MNHVAVLLHEHSKCCIDGCDHKGLLDVKFDTIGSWGYVCVEHWLSKAMGVDMVKPFLGTGKGHLLLTLEQEKFFPDHDKSPRHLQITYGNDDRYAMLIRGNRVVYTQDRKYNELETDPPVLRCVFDIMARLLPLESDCQDGGIKIWLEKARGGKW